MTGVIQLAGTITVRRFAVITIGALQVAFAGSASGIAEVSVIAGVAVRRRVFFPTLALPGGVGAVSGRIKVIAVAG